MIIILSFPTLPLSPPGTRRPSANLPRRKGPVCRHRAQIRPSALFLVRQTEPSRGSAGLRHQVSARTPPVLCPASAPKVCSLLTAALTASAGMPSPCGISTQMSEPELKKNTLRVRYQPNTLGPIMANKSTLLSYLLCG